MRPRIAFLGSPEFAVPSLRATAEVADVQLVVTQPDRPAGRGRKLEPTPVRLAAVELGCTVVTWERGGRAQVESRLAPLGLDALVVVAFGVILKPSTLATAACGAVNVHASLLPRWRGVAPVERALVAGDAVTGITLMQIDPGIDTGPMLRQRIVPIEPADTRVSLLQRLAQRGAELLREALVPFARGEIPPVPQDDTAATYAPRLEKSEGALDWTQDPVRLWNRVRGLYEWPGAVTTLAGTPIKVHTVQPLDCMAGAAPGTIVRAEAQRGVWVACGGGTLELVELQLPGKPRLRAAQLVSGRVLRAGMRFGS